MLEPRIIPCLLLSDEGLVKTVRFKSPHYVGDPVNIISIFNQFEVDELVLLNIDASVKRKGPAFELLHRVANECMVPLAYGGGITSVEQIQRIFKIGVEKVVLNSALQVNPQLISQAAERFGSQSIIVSIDIKPGFLGRGYEVYTHQGRKLMSRNVLAYARQIEKLGAGELLIQSIHRDGTMTGFDLPLIQLVTEAVNIPVIACGGAGKREDLTLAIKEGGASAVAAGSLFVYQSNERGVLVNFPSRLEIEELLSLKAF